ncbi:MAG TPA: CPBP family intramembrane glutamic endopeptidase [Thermoanaerobaculia bacterium]
MRERLAALSPAIEILLVNGVCFAIPIATSIYAIATHKRVFEFSNGEAFSMVVIELLSLSVAGSILAARGWRIADMHILPTLPMTLGGIAITMAYLFGLGILGALFQSAGIPLEVVKFEVTASIAAIIIVSLVNAVFEESILTGYNLRAMATEGAAFAISVSTFIRFLYHMYQGPFAASAMLLLGVLAGAVYWRWRRLWPIVFAHATLDVVGLTQA